MKITYFTWIRSVIGASQQEICLSSNIKTVADLIAWLSTKNENYQKAFSNMSVINISVNDHLVADLETAQIKDSDNISVFSPMAGG